MLIDALLFLNKFTVQHNAPRIQKAQSPITRQVHERRGLSHYQRIWDGLPEEDIDKANANLSVEQQQALPARTGLHRSPVGLKWKQICERGDEFYDWDAHAFHFIGGMPLKSDGSMALYEAKEQEIYLQELTEAMKKSAQP